MVKYKVSVIIPAYNCSRYIVQAIDSCLEQDANVPLQVIVINDCSKDDLDSVMEIYKENERVYYFKNHKNLGVAATRNRGVDVSVGEYIAFLDADDWWVRSKLRKQLRLLESRKAVFTYTAREIVSQNGKSTGKVMHVPKAIDYKTLLRGNIINCSSVLIRRRVASQIKMEHDEAHEDYITWLRILKKYHRAYGINEPLVKYRLTENGKSRNKAKSAYMTYMSYRYVGIGRMKSMYYFMWYVINSLRKYR